MQESEPRLGLKLERRSDRGGGGSVALDPNGRVARFVVDPIDLGQPGARSGLDVVPRARPRSRVTERLLGLLG